MPATPDSLGTATTILWNVPQEIASRTDINKIKIWRSQTSENDGYTLLNTIDTGAGANMVTSYIDATLPTRSAFYLVTFATITGPTTDFESNYNTTYYYPLPRELRLIESIRRSMPDVISKCGIGLNDSDYMVGLRLALGIFNSYPPETYFNLKNFPASHEYFLIGLASLTTLASRFLPISIRDWAYSEPGGVVMTVDRGAKINQALQVIGQVYTQYLPLVKLDFSDQLPTGVGTIQLPLSMGGVVSRGLLNVLDIFTATGR
jgi:hypothetical protein